MRFLALRASRALEWGKRHYATIRAVLPAILVGATLLLVLLAIRSSQNAQNQKFARLFAAQHLSLVEGCQRLDILRAEDNTSHYADYLVFNIVYTESKASPPPRHRRERHFQDLFLKQLQAAVHAKSWTPITNCKKAVNSQGTRYRPPIPVPFYKRLPPASALHYRGDDSLIQIVRPFLRRLG